MEPQSIPDMFFTRAASRGARPAQLVKRGGAWQAVAWEAMSEQVRHIALGLLTLDLQVGDRVALLANSRAEWVQCDLGIMAAAGITVPVYPSSLPEQVAYILHNAEVTLAIVDTPAQLAKVLQVRAELPALRHIVLMDTMGAQAEPQVLSLQELITRGAAASATHGAVLDERWRALTPAHEATYVYTSGTTGPPKGVVQTHGNHLFMAQRCGAITGAQEGDVNLLFLPLAHSFARLEAFLGLEVGLTTAFAESIDALVENMREVRPMLVFSVPRVYEKIYARVQAAGHSGSALKQAIFQWCIRTGQQVSARQQQRQSIPLGLQLRQRLAHQLVFKKLHHTVGGRLRYFVSGGAPLAQEIAEFFHAAGMLILEGYGLTETCPALTANRYDRYKFGTVGQAIPGVELRIAADGEILARGPNIARGYYKRPEASAEVFLEDGWFATGDIGEIDHEGFLRITDRKKDLIVTAGGKNIAPQNLENLLKTDLYISQAMVYGDRRPYLTAVVTLDLEATQQYARAKNIPVDTSEALAAHPQIVQLLEDRVTQMNAQLASYESIKKIFIAPTDFTPESGELTPTLKVKRKVVTEKYQQQLEQLYTG
ncbi:MAG: long-chain fatty acid--CoA ligase [Candidatus Tectomicrobia bacterium]|uniref:Long-chain fatty acid--CoA ligase n=1 Tax=Tectimicrobiota bacterium TaxID=2528274 RepID=A0A938B0W3_UNCTE|nr:long-chain fatty acid--CoA ligase [Candidatus Tectomicrobia bacterium]